MTPGTPRAYKLKARLDPKIGERMKIFTLNEAAGTPIAFNIAFAS